MPAPVSHHNMRPKNWQHIIMLILLTLAMVLPGLASLPVIDRDEARYAQASIQMAETGDLINIKFQDQARNKKPAGIYWLQIAALKTFSTPDKRQIWVHRLPSVLGALIAVIATYWGGSKLIGRDKAFISAAFLATALLFIFEAHIAKTDAILCGLSACLFAALADLCMTELHMAEHHQNEDKTSQSTAWLFWLALGASMMIKGPILLAIVAITLIGFWVWEKDLSWAKPLLRRGPIFGFLLIWLPWAISIYLATDGAFFRESLGQDLGGKLISAQEKHPGLPGYHALLSWAMLWPASLFLVPSAVYMIKTIWKKWTFEFSSYRPPQDYKALQLCFLWIVPFWILIEFMPTKLPHYSLPLYPAICLMMGASLGHIQADTAYIAPTSRNLRRLAWSGVFLLVSFLILGALAYIAFEYGEPKQFNAAIIMAILAGSASLYAAYAMMKNKINAAIKSLIIAALIVSFSGYKIILPGLKSFNISARIAAELKTDLPRRSGKILISPDYREPSLVYHLGTKIQLGHDGISPDIHAIKAGHIILIDKLSKRRPNILAKLEYEARENGICLDISKPISGFNYSKGQPVKIHIVQNGLCPNNF